MSGSDEEFEEFLKRRKAVFERSKDELFEPPAEVDRVVLRLAREAIKPEEPLRMFTGPRWAMPVALAATLLLAFTIIFQAGMPERNDPRPEVTVQSVAEVSTDAEPAAASAVVEVPAWRLEPKSWLAEIERLRASGEVARADAEYAEFKRQQRAYAVAPDR